MITGNATVFENPQEKAVAEEYYKQMGMEEMAPLSQKDKDSLSRAWAAGHYNAPESGELDDTITQVRAQAARNETYLSGDRTKFEEKLRSLLPAQPQKPARKAL